MAKEQSALRARWDEHASFRLRETLVKGNGVSPFGVTTDALADFRGLTIDDSLHNLTIARADFSHCFMRLGQFGDAAVEGCVFVGAQIECYIYGNFQDCDFDTAILRNSVFVGQFRRCTFRKGNLVCVRASGAHFVDCMFDAANLKKASFFDCSFERCSFLDSKFGSGSLAGSRFDGCRFTTPSFTKMVMNRVKGLDEYL